MQSRGSGGIGVTAVSVLRNSHSRHSAHFTLDQGSKTNNGSASTSTRAQGGLRAKFHTGSINKSHSTRNTDDESDSLRAVLLERRARATIRADKADRALSSRALTAPSQASGTAPESDTSDTITPLMKAIIDHDNDKVLRYVCAFMWVCGWVCRCRFLYLCACMM